MEYNKYMKFFFLFQFVFIGLFNTVFSQEDLNKKSFYKELNDTLFIYKFEVSNDLYSDFLNSKEYGSDAKVEVDTLQWLKKESYSVFHASYYHNATSFKNCPVVNISQEAAELFCKWLTKKYNSNPKRIYKKVLYRLPTEKEWELAAKGGNINSKYGWKGSQTINKQGKKMGNFHLIQDTLNPTLTLIENVKSFYPNKYGLYNMSGNVSEMVHEKELVKGGDWYHNSEYCIVGTKLLWDGTPKSYIGFRFVMVVKEK